MGNAEASIRQATLSSIHCEEISHPVKFKLVTLAQRSAINGVNEDSERSNSGCSCSC